MPARRLRGFPSMARNSTNGAGKLLSVGYQLRTLEELVGILLDQDIDFVVDVRERPHSRKKGLSRKPLQAHLNRHGIGYFHADFAGNPADIRHATSTHYECLRAYSEYLCENPEIVCRLDAVVRPELELGKRVCLLCYERHPDDCHRICS